jgi:hypothetical protein
MSETQQSHDIQKALEGLGALVVRVQAGVFRGANGHVVRAARKGTPDLWVAYRGEAGWLETKTPEGRLSPEQKAWHEHARKLGVRVEVPRSVEQALRTVRAWAEKECA